MSSPPSTGSRRYRVRRAVAAANEAAEPAKNRPIARGAGSRVGRTSIGTDQIPIAVTWNSRIDPAVYYQVTRTSRAYDVEAPGVLTPATVRP